MTLIPDRVFVTGTGTGIGKSVVSSLLVARAACGGRRAGYLKPAQTGVEPRRNEGDAAFVREICATAGVPAEIETVYELTEALAPAVAAERAGAKLEIGEIRSAYEVLKSSCEVVVVEGAGGLLVPFFGDVLMADLALALDLPLIIACSPELGTLNHTRLTVEAARARGIEVAGLVISGWPADPGIAEQTNLATIEAFTEARLLAMIDEIPGLDTEVPNRAQAKALLGGFRESD